MNHDAGANTKVVLSFTRYDEGRAHGLKWCRRDNNSRLLVSAVNDVPVQLNYAHVKPLIQSDVNTPAKRHGKAGFVHMEIADPEDRG